MTCRAAFVVSCGQETTGTAEIDNLGYRNMNHICGVMRFRALSRQGTVTGWLRRPKLGTV